LFIIKENFKKLEPDIKIWNKEVYGDVNKVGVEIEKKIQELDDESELGEEEKRRENRIISRVE